MQKTISGSQELTDAELRKALRQLVDLVAKGQPDVTPKMKEDLVNGMFNSFKRNNFSRTRDRFTQPQLIKKLTCCIAATLSGNKNAEANLVNALKKLFADKNMTLEKLAKMTPKEFKKFINETLTPKEQTQLKDILGQFAKQLATNMEKFKLKPSPKVSESVKDDLYTNLFGLINSAVAGGLAVPITQYIGNGLGLNDWNPNDGAAPINTVNSIKDTQLGDPQGLTAQTRENYLQLSDTLVDDFKDTMYKSGLAPGIQPPTLTRE
jgi:hypothetical protein